MVFNNIKLYVRWFSVCIVYFYEFVLFYGFCFDLCNTLYNVIFYSYFYEVNLMFFFYFIIVEVKYYVFVRFDIIWRNNFVVIKIIEIIRKGIWNILNLR